MNPSLNRAIATAQVNPGRTRSASLFKQPDILVSAQPKTVAIDLSHAKVLRYRDGEKVDVGLPVSKYSFDNSHSRSHSLETISLRQRTAVFVTVDFTKATSSAGGGGLNFMGVIAAEARISSDVRRNHSVHQENELVFEQTTTVSVPKQTHVLVIIHWKLVWQRGIASLTAEGHSLNVPYILTTELRFDKETVDVS
jgi:hypothetical protein